MRETLSQDIYPPAALQFLQIKSTSSPLIEKYETDHAGSRYSRWLIAELIESPIPKPGKGQLLIKVHAAAANPKDWKMPEIYSIGSEGKDAAINQGEDMAGKVHELGEGVKGFAIGDRVAALHSNSLPYGAYADFAIAEARLAFHMPDSMSYEEASTIPLAGITASWALYRNLSLPAPWNPSPSTRSTPLIINGGSTSVGAFAIKLASLANIHPILATAGSSASSIQVLLDPSKGDRLIDHRAGPEATISSIKTALGDTPCYHALECVGSKAGIDLLKPLVHPEGTIAMAMPLATQDEKGPKLETMLSVGVHESRWGPPPAGGEVFGAVMMRYFEYALREGTLSGHPFKVVEGGLGGIQGALENLKEGKVSGRKYVFRIEETGV